MSRKRGRVYPTNATTRNSIQTIDMNELNRKKTYYPVCFKTGGHMTIRDRPRQKNWLKEYREGG